MTTTQVAEDCTVDDVITGKLLVPAYQPIASLIEGEILGHETLIRGPSATPLAMPDALFDAALDEGLLFELELACMDSNLRGIAAQGVSGKYFINLGAGALVRVVKERGLKDVLIWATRRGLAPGRIVIEITEHQRVEDFDALVAATNTVRALGIAFAIDDFGEGRSSLRLWAELQPEFVKIDKYFTRDLGQHPAKIQTLKTIVQMAETLGGHLIAEGIETEHAMALVRDIGIPFGQGYYLGRPVAAPLAALEAVARAAIGKREVAVAHHRQVVRHLTLSADKLLIRSPSVGADTTTDEVVALLRANPHQQGVAVVEDDRPVGLINRRALMDRYTQPFQKELFGRRSCTAFMDAEPRLLERSASIEQMVALLTSDDQRYLTDGIIITEAGRYLGLGTGEQLVRTVTEHRVEAARHANPLTYLPGNVPITEHIEKLLASNNRFVCGYCDLNQFKPFNDQYGYWRGDEMIRLLAEVVIQHAANRRDFVGHVGGDDVVILFQSPDWQERCENMIRVFNERARGLFDAEALERGGIEAEDRSGNPAFFPLTTLSIGAVTAEPGQFRRAEDVASAAAVAKRLAKRAGLGLWVLEDSGVTFADRDAPRSADE